MIDYILDNMVVNIRGLYKDIKNLRAKGYLEYTICEEISYEQRLAPEEYRKQIKNDAKSLSSVTNFELLSKLANEMIDHKVLGLDEGSGDIMILYESLAETTQHLFITDRVVVSDDQGVIDACSRHAIACIDTQEFKRLIQEIKRQ